VKREIKAVQEVTKSLLEMPADVARLPVKGGVP
jgi:hypothetical protein